MLFFIYLEQSIIRLNQRECLIISVIYYLEFFPFKKPFLI